ncbi:MAG: SDR family oxidoreductase [Pseudomonadota bacterium]
MDIDNRHFVVTGAARGLGLAITRTLLDRGGRVTLADVDADSLARARRALDAVDRTATCVCDVSDEHQVETLFNAAQAAFGAVHGVVCNAGILRDALLVKAENGEVTNRMSLQAWQAVIDVNLTGVFLTGREAASRMVAHGEGGVIVNISSISRAGNPGQSNYAAAKAGVAALTTTWAGELARYGIRCNAVAPGVIDTDMVASMKADARDRLISATRVGRLGTVEELADAVRFLIENGFNNGRVLEFDGGMRL